MKGVNIFLVVFGHCIQFGNGREFSRSEAFFDDVVFKVIYSFHMPLFALVSGYLFYWSLSSRSPREVLLRQMNNYVLPSFSWALIIECARAVYHVWRGNFAGISRFIMNTFNVFMHSLWFLWAMFICSVIVLAGRVKFNDSFKFYALVLMALLFAPNKIFPGIYTFMLPYFVAGYLWHREGLDERFSFTLPVKAGVIALWVIMLCFYGRNDYIYRTGVIIIDYSQGVFKYWQLWTDIFRWVIGFAGSLSVLMLLSLVKPVNAIAKVGMKSLGVYIISGYVFSFLPESGGYVVNFAEAVMITVMCYCLSVMISRNRMLNRLMFGGR